MTLDEVREQEIVLTPAASKAVQELLQKRELEGYGLRIFVSGGGCSGLQYGMALENKVRENDLTWEFDGIKVIVDDVSILYLNGAKVDYIEDIMESGFKIENPNAVASCGCGNSFNTQKGSQSRDTSAGCSGC